MESIRRRSVSRVSPSTHGRTSETLMTTRPPSGTARGIRHPMRSLGTSIGIRIASGAGNVVGIKRGLDWVAMQLTSSLSDPDARLLITRIVLSLVAAPLLAVKASSSPGREKLGGVPPGGSRGAEATGMKASRAPADRARATRTMRRLVRWGPRIIYAVPHASANGVYWTSLPWAHPTPKATIPVSVAGIHEDRFRLLWCPRLLKT